VAASTSPTLTAWTHTTLRPATAALSCAGTRPSRCRNPARYRPRSLPGRNMRASQYGAPTTSTAISSKLYSAITTDWTTFRELLRFTTVSAKTIIKPA